MIQPQELEVWYLIPSIRKELVKKTRYRKERTENLKKLEEPLRKFIIKCKEKMEKEDKPFLSMKDYFNIMIELGYRKEIKWLSMKR